MSLILPNNARPPIQAAVLRERPEVQRDQNGRMLYMPDGLELTRYVLDRSQIGIIRGPWGSGKTAASIQRLWNHCLEQNLSTTHGRLKRRSRWFVMRESYPRIETTTLESFLDWFPPSIYGRIYTGTRPYRYEIRIDDLEVDVFFGAQDDSASDAMFKSLEPTGWYWNELEFIQMSSFFSGHGRVGRFPRAIDGGSRWSGSIADTNAPGDGHWLPIMMGEVGLPDDVSLDEREAYRRPDDLAYFVQAPAVIPIKDAMGRIIDWRVNPDAENLKWLADYGQPEAVPGERYYKRARAGKTVRWIRANLRNEIVATVDGDPVFPSYDETIHLSPVPLDPVPGEDVAVGLDFGRRPAAVFTQKINGQRQIQFDLAMQNAGATRFAPAVRELLAKNYPWVMAGRGGLRLWGDPKGQDGTQTTDETAYDIFRGVGLNVLPAPVKQNNIDTRIDAVEYDLGRLIAGRPALIVSPRATRVKVAMGGGYRFPKERPSPTSDRKPVKDGHSDIGDAIEYVQLGEGAGREMAGRGGSNRGSPVSTRPNGGRSYRRGGK